MERFRANYPEYDLSIDTSGRLVDFTAERVDVGIRCGGGRWPGLEATFLLRDAFFPVCSPALLKGKHPLKSAADLKHHALIRDTSMSLESAFPTWRAWLRNAGLTDFDCEGGLQINDSAAAFQAAIAGNGVALGRTTLVARDLAEGRLVWPFGEAMPCDLAYYIVHKEGNSSKPAIVAFKDWLLSEASLDV